MEAPGQVGPAMSDLDAALVAARHDLARLVEAWQVAVNTMALGYGPDGIDYQPRTPPARDDDGPDQVPNGDITPSHLSVQHAKSVRQLRHAVLAASELSWIPDDVAQVSVLPDGERLDQHRTTPVPHRCGMAMVREIRVALAGAQWRLAGPYWRYHGIIGVWGPQRQRIVPPPLDFADTVHLRAIATHVGTALDKMPRELWMPVPAGHDQTPDLKRCTGGPGRKHCPNYVPWSAGEQCETCTSRTDDLTAEYDSHRGEPCRNPWDRPQCRGQVAVPKRALCKSCDQFRRNALRQTAA
jgi:hypothetical protein